MTEEGDTGLQQPSRLLALPGELENRIYRLVLVKPEDNPIVITATGYDRGGGLLQTCKQIRGEALKIFYYENKFTHVHRQFDATPMIAFFAPFPRLGLIQKKVTVKCTTANEPCWRNLPKWLRHTHEALNAKTHLSIVSKTATETLLKLGITSLAPHVCCIMFVTVHRLEKQPWHVAEDVILSMRPSLIAADHLWAEDL